MKKRGLMKSLVAGAVAGVFVALPAAAWEPTKNVEFIVPAGTGGGADQMARFIQSVVAKNNKEPLSISNPRQPRRPA